MSNKVKVYTITPCPYCEAAKNLLKMRGIAFDAEMISRDDDARRDELYQRSKMKTFPQIFHGDRLIGGYDELATLDRQDQLVSLR